ncbi:16S rRNA (guanine(966)-N(2))-methyltransferase RsmD [Falsihalocynthiibacter sp. SS001]|uniref:16S rRNA (guanine(966)-N(2))-methyltransferase RsmD n=1 Tax=Falsihalocynthiibacter sp. SS001 TaxID=3349698 RepID=UPI0036D3268D
MRIIAGAQRGLKLAEVGKGDTDAHLRPTTDRIRESLFNVLNGGAYGRPIEGARVLDLFAGTGALGLEALSRGASHVTFVDNGRAAQKLLRENIKLTRRENDCTVLKTPVTELGKAPQACDLIFLDPPYGQNLGGEALLAAQIGGWIASDALIVWEEDAPVLPPAGFERLDARRYGNTHITFIAPTS